MAHQRTFTSCYQEWYSEFNYTIINIYPSICCGGSMDYFLIKIVDLDGVSSSGLIFGLRNQLGDSLKVGKLPALDHTQGR